MNASRLLAVLAAVPLLLLASCASTSTPSTPVQAEQQSHVKVDTPALRSAKKAAGVRDCTPTTAPAASSGLPDYTLPCLGGGPAVRLSGLRGPLVVNLFAQWCGPCRSEMPYYQQLAQKGRGTVKVLGIDYLDTQPGLALELVRRTGVTYPLLADPAGSLRRDLHVLGLPGIVLIDKDGNLVGPPTYRVFRSYAELRTLVSAKLGVALPR
ncbi:MAG: TlpA family protein disulfide reductase [Nocardioides sp.]